MFLVPVEANAAVGERTIRRPVLAEGETTGHAHRVTNALKGQVFTVGTKMFLEVEGMATIVHEEHGPITVPNGLYEVRIQREYHPRVISRPVMD